MEAVFVYWSVDTKNDPASNFQVPIHQLRTTMFYSNQPHHTENHQNTVCSRGGEHGSWSECISLRLYSLLDQIWYISVIDCKRSLKCHSEILPSSYRPCFWVRVLSLAFPQRDVWRPALSTSVRDYDTGIWCLSSVWSFFIWSLASYSQRKMENKEMKKDRLQLQKLHKVKIFHICCKCCCNIKLKLKQLLSLQNKVCEQHCAAESQMLSLSTIQKAAVPE